MIIKTLDIDDLEVKTELLWWQERGVGYSSTGYGRKIPTSRMVRLPGKKRWRRVYCCIYSNIGTCYVTCGKDWIVVR